MSTGEPAQPAFAGVRRVMSLTARELLVGSRAPGPYRLRFGLLAAVMVIGVLIVSESRTLDAPGQVMLGVLVTCNTVALALMAPVLFAGPIPEEKETGTLGLLKLSGFSGLGILAGKGLSQLVQVLAVLGMQIPLAVLCVTLGGVDRDQVLAAYVVLLGGVFLVFGLGTLWGTVCTTNAAAVRATVVSMLAFEFGYLLVWGLIELFTPGVASGIPPAGLVEWRANTFSWTLVEAMDLGGGFSLVAPSVYFWLGLTAVLFVVAWLVFERATQREVVASSGRGLLGLLRSLKPGRKRAEGSGTAAKRPSRFCPWQDAVLWRDFQHGTGGWASARWRVFVLVGLPIAINLVFRPISRIDLEVIGGMTWVIGLIATLALGAGAAGAVFRDEIKAQTLSALVSLPARAGGRTYRWSKLRGVLLAMVPGVVATGFGALLLLVSDSVRGLNEEAFWFVGVMMIAWFAWTLALTTWLSLKVRRGAAALGVMLGFGALFLMTFLMSQARAGEEVLLFTAFVFAILCGVQLRAVRSRLDLVEQEVS